MEKKSKRKWCGVLVNLSVNNVALIERIDIEFLKGMNVMTGETGAGKSIIIDSINAILGERVSRELIRTGTEKALVEAVFNLECMQFEKLGMAQKLEEYGIEPDEDGNLIMCREFSAYGKNTCRINGRMVTVSVLREMGEYLIDIHGQHDNQSLLRTENHVRLLDSFGGEYILELKLKYTKLLNDSKAIRKQIKAYSGDRRERERKMDLLKFQIDEIRKAKLKKGEEEELAGQRLILSNSEKLITSLSAAYGFLYSGEKKGTPVIDGINYAIKELSELVKIDQKYCNILKSLESACYQVEDMSEEIRSMRDNVEFNPGLLEEIEERLDFIYRLKRKYGSTIDEILKYCCEIEAEMEEIKNSEDIVEGLLKQDEALEKELLTMARELSGERKKAALLLESKIGSELNDLEMKKASFKVHIEFNEKRDAKSVIEFMNDGMDAVEFLISPNAGEPLKPLAKIASGGEMSRIMLAIKTILADVDEVPTLIFDEIDSGVSGKAAQKVGEKLSVISGKHQVICVTHLPQIACMADNHFLIEKVSGENETRTIVNHLNKDESRKELARILGGATITDITLKHAGEMLRNAKEIKSKL